MKNRKKNFFEGVIVFVVFTGLLLPVRLFFVTYVSDNWFGSFGIISLISISLIILTKKGKLGKFGKMFDRQFEKIQRGKKAKFVYFQVFVLLAILGGTIYSIEFGNSHFLDLKNEIVSENKELTDPEHLLSQAERITIQKLIISLFTLFISFFISFPQVAVIFAILNDTFDGWILHFYTVAFVECFELFGILLFHKILSRKWDQKIHKIFEIRKVKFF